jgi:hypothetical protein
MSTLSTSNYTKMNKLIYFLVTVYTPQSNETLNFNGSTDYIDENSKNFLFSSIFDFINKYLRFFFGVIAFAILLYI